MYDSPNSLRVCTVHFAKLIINGRGPIRDLMSDRVDCFD
jgi:hypothetical protein